MTMILLKKVNFEKTKIQKYTISYNLEKILSKNLFW
jgi:hypothetical protein